MDLLDFYRGGMTVRRLWVLLEHWCLRRGTAVAFSLHGERGRWTTSDEILAQVHGAKIPEDKVQIEWKQSQQERIRAKRARVAAERAKTP